MAFDYTNLLAENSLIDSWQDIYDRNLSLAENLLSLLPSFVVLPKDYYDIIAAYCLIPNALARIVPYLFLFGRSGTGKTTIAKFISYLWGVPVCTSSDTYASIRNQLHKIKYTDIKVETSNPEFPDYYKRVETNKGMVWDDIDSNVFINKPDLYRLFKVGYDRSTDRISISSDIKGENLVFRCFCTKVFSSVSPIHLESIFKELQRRLIVIPFKRIEDIEDDRLRELNTLDILNIDAFDWNGFSLLHSNFWNTELAEVYLITRKAIAKNLIGLNSQQKGISLDLITTGIVTGIWLNETEALNQLKDYFAWFKTEVDNYSGIAKYLADYVYQESRNAMVAGLPVKLNAEELRRQIEVWLHQNWILEKPKTNHLKALMAELGMVLDRGYWIKRN